MIQGVREVFEIVDLDNGGKGTAEEGGEQWMGKMVLIGRGLDGDAFGESLRWSLDGGGGGEGEV